MSELITAEFFPAAYWYDGSNFVRLTDDGEQLIVVKQFGRHDLEALGVTRKDRVRARGLNWLDGDLFVGEFMRNDSLSQRITTTARATLAQAIVENQANLYIDTESIYLKDGGARAA